MMKSNPRTIVLIATCLAACLGAKAEDGAAAWLRYAPIANPAQYRELPSRIVVMGDSPTERAAGAELQRGLTKMLGREFTVTGAAGLTERAIVLDRERGGSGKAPDYDNAVDIRADTYRIASRNPWQVQVLGASTRAELYGVFHLLELIATAKPLPSNEGHTPSAPIRWTDEWDNLNGTIERGYAGRSIFFENGHVRADLSRAGEYARLLASVGMNGCNVNNVNADLDTLSPEHLHEFARIADVFRPWGVRLALSIDLTSPQTVGGLDTFDPADPKVIAWWQAKADEIYKLMPDFGGFTVKADSEGRKGPSQYGRTPADAANVLARALKPHGGVVLYRGFVYNNHLDWNDRKADRARAGVDNFVKNDGTFDSNVIIQIKEGPIDFQAREPVSPLFAALHRTNVAIEVQTAQEYTGQQRHMVFLPSMWKWVLDTDLHAPAIDGKPRATPVKQIITGHTFPNADGTPRLGGFISVTNVGLDANWLHHPMAMANLYGFGRLAWNPDTPLDEIANTWSTMTWGSDAAVRTTVPKMLLTSWQVYEGYTGPNGIGTLTNILGYHFGPGIESAERNGWGQWFRGEKDGIGMDRTARGSGYIQQYPPELAAQYESLATVPDNLLLFFHHVPYDHRLHSGKTLVQSIYDTHYASARAAAEYVPQWKSLEGKVDAERYTQTLQLLEFQTGHAIVWRDAINTWFQKQSGIPDATYRVGSDTGRIEAEAMKAEGYTPIEVTPWETASAGKVVVCREVNGCTLTTTVPQPRGRYNVAVQYYDMWRGASRYELLVDGKSVAQWRADDTLPPAQYDAAPDGQTATRFTAHGVALHPGATLTLHAVPDLRTELENVVPAAEANSQIRARDYREYAPVDYIVIGPDGDITPH
ncbi:alpha-glucuronidase family glycosyl hydrolase [Terriglobus roseus]|uniref:Xylan alpha-1,2-glucuronidase n=1 Tax=Terriglobus roseus TaxID=392734 RepID=A0A1H4P0Z7_9BACT|nr:alpha-glucuronidase family glycosyl hydrolase [Terriglobus roseus]SEC00828.1 alpha-glucuronidase [Terriglobus roseus]